MARVPINRLKKTEIAWLANNKCRHSHSYLSHFNCYLEELPSGAPMVKKIGFFDLEFHNLKASIGVLFGYCIKEADSDVIHEDWISRDQGDFKQGQLPDKRVVESCVRDVKKFDMLVTYYGTRCDIPYIRTKALMNDLDFPEYGDIIHLDLYYIVRNKFSLHRNSLDVACETLLGESDKTRVTPKHWMSGLFGDSKALNYIADHCRRDVKLTERLYNKVIPYRKRLDQSA